MAALIETSIRLALKSRVESLTVPFPKAWPGETFNVPHDGGLPQPYLRIGRVSVDPVGIFIKYGQKHRRTGALMVTLVHPLNLPLVEMYDQYAAEIADHFIDGTCVRYGNVQVVVTDYPHVQEGYEDNGYWTVPVRIPWRCFA